MYPERNEQDSTEFKLVVTLEQVGVDEVITSPCSTASALLSQTGVIISTVLPASIEFYGVNATTTSVVAPAYASTGDKLHPWSAPAVGRKV